MKTKIIFFSSVLLLVFTGCRKWIPKPFKKIKTFTISGTLYLRCDGPTMANVKLELWPQPFHKSKEIFYTTTDANGNFTFHCSDEKSFFTNTYSIWDPRGPLIKNISPLDTTLDIFINSPQIDVIFKILTNKIYLNIDTFFWAQTMSNDILNDSKIEYLMLDTIENNKIFKIQNGGVNIDNLYKGSVNIVWGKGYSQFLRNAKLFEDRLKSGEKNIKENYFQQLTWQGCGDKIVEMNVE